MSVSLQILQDDLLKIWSAIEMHQISLTVGLLFCLLILKMNLHQIDRRDFTTELMYTIFITFCVLTLVIVVPDSMRKNSSLGSQIILTVIASSIAFLRWNIRPSSTRRRNQNQQTSRSVTGSKGAENGKA